MPSDRSLDITVNFTGIQASDGSYSGTATYKQTRSLPPIPNLVASNGDIDLQLLQSDPGYHWAIGINFTLDAVVTDRSGNNVLCVWASPATSACVLTGPDGGPAQGMTVTRSSDTKLSIANDNNDRSKPLAERTYSYKLGVMLPSVNDYFMSLDPKITNTGPVTGGG